MLTIFAAIITGGVFIFADLTRAQQADVLGVEQVEESIALGSEDIRVIIARIIRAVLGLLGIIALVIVIYGGFVYMTSGGNDERIATAKKILINGGIGLAIILSAFAITQFVLNQLGEATGILPGTDRVIDENCSDPTYYNQHPILCGGSDFPTCEDRYFVVKSITPNTGDTGMNNLAVRVIFSRDINSGFNITDVMNIFDGNSELIPLSVSFVDDNRSIVEAVYSRDQFCNGDQTCFDQGSYRVEVNPDVSDQEENYLETETSCGSYPRTAVFGVNSDNVIDNRAPRFNEFTINNDAGGGPVVLRRGGAYPIEFTVTDESGIGYARLRVYRENSSPDSGVSVYDGPRLSADSKDPYSFEYSYGISDAAEPLDRYIVEAQVHDSDHNMIETLGSFVIVGENCDASGRPVSQQYADECLGQGGDSCEQDSDCASGVCDLQTNQCVDVPVIIEVDPWQGAAGNFVTIMGGNFGTVPGTIEFSNEGGWVQADLADCGDLSVWNDKWIVARVPDDQQLPIGTESVIRLRIPQSEGIFVETTTDDNGPIAGPNQGLFVKNDVVRPSLCSVITKGEQIEDSFNFALPGTEVLALGFGFGPEQEQSRIEFGGVVAPVSNWSGELIETGVPQNLSAGVLAVKVIMDGVESNGVPFTVLAYDEENIPVIESIDPVNITPGSFLTIYGRNLGQNPGTVHLSSEPGVDCDNSICMPVPFSLPSICGDTWQDNQIIVQITDDTPPGTYYVSVHANDMLARSEGVEALNVQAGKPSPSICRLSPGRGPAPLPAGSNGLEIAGINFGNDPTVYFWWKDADLADVVGTWLSTQIPGNWILSAGENLIRTLIPETADNYSMRTGPIKVGRDEGVVLLSNSVFYTVEDCRENPDSPIADTHKCCTSGEDAGLWRPFGTACKGEVRTAGYNWRFTTGFMPMVPQVVETCDQDNWNNVQMQLEFPSPTPWERWRRGRQACLNSDIAVRFTMSMDEVSFDNNIRLFSCGSEEEKDCENAVEITDFNLIFEEQIIRVRPATILDQNTWYRVQLLEGIRSAPQTSVLGVSEAPAQNLLSTEPCGPGTAYCFDFRTGSEQCTITAAGINPPFYRALMLGELPFYYYLWGRGNQECSVMPVDGLGWKWASSKAAASVEPKPDDNHTDTRAKGRTYSHTAPEAVDITAMANVSTVTGGGVEITDEIRASSTLIIDLEDPQVENFWPNCAEACINTGIGAGFNRHMNTDSFQNNIYLQKCQDELCTAFEDRIVFLEVPPDSQNYFELHAYLPAAELLEAGSWYKVTVRGGAGGVISLGQLEPVELDGKTMEQDFSWKFRTKSEDLYCQIDRVGLYPDPFTARMIGEKTKYSAIAYGSPDECSPFGQELNPWNFGWQWDTTDNVVATVSNFALLGNLNTFCTLSCLPAGSDVLRGSGEEFNFLCGNGRIDPGEDCDVGMVSETVGISCSLQCLRPGSEGENCGDGDLDVDLGEECDPALDSYCSDTCLWTGSPSSQPEGELDTPWCGSGSVTIGEDCDLAIDYSEAIAEGDPSLTGQYGCSNSCLHTGTPLAQSWCTGSGFENTQECRRAVSVCGNGILEQGEECEIGIAGATEEVCSAFCLLQNACGTDFAQCQVGSQGCSDDCTLAGSSIKYDNSSLCGDGVLGTGESPDCELPAADPQSQLGANPVQAVTAVGAGEVNQDTLAQFTKVRAEARSVRGNTQVNNLSSPVAGDADYFLQCGYSEFEQERDGRYNDCAANADNSSGVGINSCCYQRPTRESEYPVSGVNSVCRNSFISVTFDKEMDPDTLAGNLVIARGSEEADFDCQGIGEKDVTDLVKRSLAYAGEEQGFFAAIWSRIKNFFRNIFGREAIAAVETWCSGSISVRPEVVNTYSADGQVVSSTVNVYISKLLEASTTYAVVLRGGVEGMADVRGVGIKHAENTWRQDAWQFKTGSEVCKLKSIQAVPDYQLFSAPLRQANFTAEALSVNSAGDSQQITRIPGVYYWEWSWGPVDNDIFDIPIEGGNANSENITIAAREVEGEVEGLLSAAVTVDADPENNQAGQVFNDHFILRAMFCEKPWPAINEDNTWQPFTAFEDEGYYLTMSYCSDAGQSGRVFDDLPFLRMIDVTDTTELLGGVQKKYLFFNDKNDDVIGVQIFNNEDFSRLSEWYQLRGFGNLDQMQTIEIDGYEALTDGNNYYINAYNLTGEPATGNSTVYKNIYLFSINVNAGDDTREVFSQLIDSLRVNTNMSDLRQCTTEEGGEPLGRCVSDFDCSGLAPELPEGCVPKFNCGDTIDYEGGPYSTVRIGTQCWMSENLNVGQMLVHPVAQSNNGVIEKKCYENSEQLCSSEGGLYSYREAMQYSNQEGTRGICPIGWHIPTDAEWMRLEEFLGMCGGSDSGCSGAWNWRGTDQGTQLKSTGTSGFNALLTGYYMRLNKINEFYSRNLTAAFWSSTAGPRIGYITRVLHDYLTKVLRYSYEFHSFSVRCVKDAQDPPNTCPDLGPLAGENIVCNADKTKFFRDLKRLSDISRLQRRLDNYYDQNGTYPNLEAGTFLPGYTVSKWPSWGNQLGSALPGLAMDPINRWEGCRDFDPAVESETCWNADSSRYVCPRTSSVYEYKYNSNDDYDFHVPLEYISVSNGIVDQIGVDRTNFVTSPYCQPDQSFTPQGGSCGDGMINPGEACDPPGTFTIGTVGMREGSPITCPLGQVARQTCTDQCQIQYGGCSPRNQCGNGIVEGVEFCDDGNNEDEYGGCNSDCTDRTQNYCGDGEVQDEFEYCDWSVNNWELWSMDGENSCSYDCQSQGGYCGDGLLQSEHEQCDDGNSEDFDGCSAQCKTENMACFEAQPYFTVTQQEDDMTYIYISEGKYNVFDSKNGDFEGTPIFECSQNITGDQICHSFGLVCDSVVERFGKKSNQSGDPTIRYKFRGYNSVEYDETCVLNLDIDDSLGYRVECEGIYEGLASAPEAAAVAGSCGDGVAQERNNEGVAEACDLGALNGVPCEPEYGERCSYCSEDCTDVLFREPLVYCGDGVVQTEFGENCESTVGGVLVSDEICSDSSEYGEYTICSNNNVAGCTDVGQVSCGNDCRSFSNNCTECVPTLDQDIATEARMAFVNPIAGYNEEHHTDLNNSFSEWYLDPARNFDPLQHIVMYRWYDQDEADWYDPTDWMDIIVNDFNFGWRRLGSKGGYGSPNYFDYSAQFALREAGSDQNMSAETVKLETDRLCSDEYMIYFSPFEIKKPESVDIDIYDRDELLPYGDFFSYAVDGESGPIEHEYIVSPAVPSQVFRVVVRWTGAEDESNVEFRGQLYTSYFAQDVKTVEGRKATVKSMQSAIDDTQTDSNNDFWYCDQMEQTDIRERVEMNTNSFNHGEYFWPTGCNPYSFTEDGQQPSTYDILYVHPKQSLNDTFVQAMTIDVKGLAGAGGAPLAFFVDALGPEGVIPISNLRNSNLTVEVYASRANQYVVPAHSIYKPVLTYSIKGSAISSNPSARYWHVFNLVYGDGSYSISEVQEIQTDFCEVLNSIPGTICTP